MVGGGGGMCPLGLYRVKVYLYPMTSSFLIYERDTFQYQLHQHKKKWVNK